MDKPVNRRDQSERDHRHGQPELLALGSLLRRTRQGRFNIETLATRAGVSAGLISQIERGLGNPSFVTLSKLAYALEIPLSSFFPKDAVSDGILVRRDQRRQLSLPHEGFLYELLTPDVQRNLGLTLVSMPPGWQNAERPFSHHGEEAVHLLSGHLEIHVGAASYALLPGDTVTYDAALPHWMRNVGETPAVVLSAMTPPSF